MLKILFAALSERWEEYEHPLKVALAKAGIAADLTAQANPAEVDYIVYAPNSRVQDFAPYTRLKAVLNLWAGVEDVVGNPTLKVPLARMTDDGMVEGMRDYVLAHILRYHAGIDAHIVNPDQLWDPAPPPLARHRTVAFLGIGALGSACAQAASQLGFEVLGWSRSPKQLPGVECHAGRDGLKVVLNRAEIVVLLMPATPGTGNTLKSETLAWLPKGSRIINPGRGQLIDDDALLEALDTGHVAHATLDVFRKEPLPKAHPFWAHPNITITPHIGSTTRPDLASQRIVENIRLNEAGLPMLDVVDVAAGY